LKTNKEKQLLSIEDDIIIKMVTDDVTSLKFKLKSFLNINIIW